MSDRVGLYTAVLVIVGIFLAIQLGALALVGPFMEAEQQPVENPQDPTNSILFFGMLLVATVVMLAVIKYGRQEWIRLFVVASTGGLGWFVTDVFVAPLSEADSSSALGGPLGDTIAVGLPVVVGLAIVLGLLYYPEWYVIDGAGIVMGSGSAALFGISFSPFPAILFLTVLAVYDAISVYGTEHMLTLAEGVVDLKIPVLLVVPTSTSYSFREAGPPQTLQDESESATEELSSGEQTTSTEDVERSSTKTASADSTESETESEMATDAPSGEDTGSDSDVEREALLIGLGDAVMPTILVASAAVFLTDVPSFKLLWVTLNAPALGAILGTLAGLIILQWLVLKGRAHAGLPLLNGGAITGYLVAAVASGLPLLEAIGI
jgi:presenilin-like A22 family membrane protease